MQLKQEDDEMSQLDALTQLNELLAISNEESLSLFPLDQLIPALVRHYSPSRQYGHYCEQNLLVWYRCC